MLVAPISDHLVDRYKEDTLAKRSLFDDARVRRALSLAITSAKLKGWEITPSHLIGQDLADVWLDQ
jgi:hypothetical protein